MSFILDALKRAERERSLGRAPDVQDVARQLPPPVDGPRQWNPLLIAVIVVLVAVVLVLGGLELGRPRSMAAPAVITTAPRPALTAIPTAKPIVARAPLGKPAIVDTRGIRSMDDLTGAQPSADGELPASDTPDMSGSSLQMPLRSIRTHVTETSAADAGAGIGSGTSTSFPGAATDNSDGGTRMPIEANLDRGADHPLAAPPPSETANLQPMPDSYQDGFPQVTVQVHVYNADPTRRFVMIDGKTYHQGDSLVSGPRIVEIRSSGIVFDWKGHSTLYPVNN